jgi:predicted PurR-regulated permease PerM
MAALDIIGLYVSSAFILVLIAAFGFITLKIGIFSYKIVDESLTAVKRMENYQTINQEPSEATEKLENKIKSVQKHLNSVESYFKNFRKRNIKNPKYAYIQLFKK